MIDELGTLSPAEMKLARRVDIVAASAREAARAARKQEAEARELQAQVRRQQAAKKKAEDERERGHQRAARRDTAGFNAVQFHRDLVAAAKGLGIRGQAALAKDAGVSQAAITDMRKGLAPTLATVLLLCDWAGMNPLQYLVRLAPGAANDASAEAAA